LSTPSCQIVIWNTAGDLIRTITEPVACNVKLNMTTAPSTFNFTVQGQDNFSYFYNDIGANYKVAIYMGRGTLGTSDVQLVGKILKINSKVNMESGVFKTFEGKCLGEVLERRQKTNKRYQDEQSDHIPSYVAVELDLGISKDFDTTLETITVRTEPYWDMLKRVSDYWYDGATKVQKDFYVDNGDGGHPNGHLVWKARPFRTVGVESLVYGEDFKEYDLTHDLMPSKNKVTVYGAPSAFLPNDKDEWTENSDTTNWTATSGTLTFADTPVTPEEGVKCVICSNSDTVAPFAQGITFQRALPNITLRNINSLNFFYYPGTTAPAYDNQTCKLLCPDTSNYFKYRSFTGASNTMHWVNAPLGDSAVYDAVENPTGVWDAVGSPNWWSIQAIQFHGDSAGSSGTLFMGIDKLYFSPDRWVGVAEDPTNQGIYDIREAEYTDENLLSNDECTKRAESLLMQLKEKTTGVSFTVQGNTNILRGDRIPLTLPPDNITAVDFDVISVEHSYSESGFYTIPQLILGADIRAFPPRNPAEALNRNLQNIKSVTREIYSRVVS
jgi:hypothetical protein